MHICEVNREFICPELPMIKCGIRAVCLHLHTSFWSPSNRSRLYKLQCSWHRPWRLLCNCRWVHLLHCLLNISAMEDASNLYHILHHSNNPWLLFVFWFWQWLLMGFHDFLAWVTGQLVLIDPIPSINKAFAIYYFKSIRQNVVQWSTELIKGPSPSNLMPILKKCC